MPEYDLVYAATLVTVAFGALMFSVLAASFWRERRRRRSVFTVFTLACAAAFLLNLLLTIAPGWATTVTAILDLATGMLPPLLLHLTSQRRKSHIRSAFYVVCSALAIARALDDAGFVSFPYLEQAPAILLASAGA